MRKTNRKMKVAFISFTLIMATVFSALFFCFLNLINKEITSMNQDIGAIAVISHTDLISFQTNEGQKIVSKDDLYSPQAFMDPYSTMFRDYLPAMLGAFAITIILSTFVLWKILIRLQRQKDMVLIKEFQSIAEPRDNHDPFPTFSVIQDEIKNKFDKQLNRYKRLHAYLSHEQKNRITVLRAKLEANGGRSLLPAIDQMQNGIDDILTLSETGSGEQTEVADVALVCAQLCDDYASLHAQISFDFDETKTYSILAKERWIYCAVGNLLDNAVKFCPDAPVSVCVKNTHGTIIVEINDHGMGISDGEQEKIFDYTYQVPVLNRDGYGIGLSLVTHVCDLCKGFVYVDSTPGIGTHCSLSFPALT